jgi:hypothetical protein
MKLTRSFVSLSLSLSLVFVSFLSFSVQQVNAQDSRIALQRGYRTGYSDGYMSGYRDAIENASRGYERHNDYAKADRAYNKEYGALEDYRDGYQQGFEIGYNTGFDKRSFDATLPVEIRRRGTITPKTATQNATVQTTTAQTTTNETANVVTTDKAETSQQVDSTENNNAVSNGTINFIPTSGEQTVVIPIDTELVIEVLGDITTERSKAGDKFQGRVVSPSEISGAIVEGRITKIQKPGRIKRRSELSMTFDRISLSDTRWANYNAILIDVLPVKGDNIKQVDVEGTVKGKNSIKSDSIKVGAATGTGLVVGAIAGGPVGAAVGAGVGAAFGVGAVVIDRGNHVNITKGQQLRIRTTYETQIR